MLRSPFSPAECQPHRPDRVHCRCDGIVFTAAARVRHAHARAGLAADPASGAAVVEHRRARAGKRCHAACPAVDRESRGVAHMRRLAGRRVRDRVSHRVAHAVGGRADGHRQSFQQLPLPAHGPARIARARRVDRLGRDDRTAAMATRSGLNAPFRCVPFIGISCWRPGSCCWRRCVGSPPRLSPPSAGRHMEPRYQADDAADALLSARRRYSPSVAHKPQSAAKLSQ